MDPEQTKGEVPKTRRSTNPALAELVPAEVEEYSIRERLGRGGFGTVYLAYDNTLQRDVALKIPHSRHVGASESVELYLREARAIASLDHPCIIPVYRAAQTADTPFYIVTKRIRGCHLGQWNTRSRPTFATLARVLAQVADALGYAHKHGLVHRDIKPSNILMDEQDHPFVADFGLAIRDIDPKGGPSYVGTPAYMSPEQARGEGHRVDGRSDVYSMGVLMYELLTGVRPFRYSDQRELYDAILYSEPEHPCHLNSEIPIELARVCLKCMSKGVGDRYQRADELAAELRSADLPDASMRGLGQSLTESSTLKQQPKTVVVSEPRVVPKGLRAFDMRDAEFFLQLLPGPRDRDGVPEIVRFWISRIELTRSDHPVTVGLIYGPSGCGKTSLVRAGLIPRLSSDVGSIYLQASAEDTEKNLTERIASRLDSLGRPVTNSMDVVDAFTQLRRQREKRTVIFIDQFEQWLFTHPDCIREPLTQALRQCDGEFLQCVLMVRDDFWMGIARFMLALDLAIAENVNATAVDLFDVRHARNVLHMFGASYGRLPEFSEHLTPAHSRFLDAAVDHLSADGRVICVQLALLTEMLKNRSWDKSTSLLRDGGAGIGVQFFEETFDSESSPRRTRIHADGTLGVLRALLPESGSRIKGAVRTKEELLEASGYHIRQQFRELISILDGELHLITPTDRGETDSVSGGSSDSGSISTGFQLTHDFLIAPIRQWIEYHNRSSREGKARLRLEEFADLYKARPRTQSLPSIAEYVGMRRHISPVKYTQSQRRLMDASRNHHLRSVGVWLLGMALLGFGVFAAYRTMEHRRIASQTRSDVARLLDANMAEAVALSSELRDSALARQETGLIVENGEEPHSRRVRASLVVGDKHTQAAALLSDFALEGPVDDVIELALGVDSSIGPLADKAANTWTQQVASRATLIRAACIVANDSRHVDLLRKDESPDRVMRLVVAENPVWVKRWSEAFRPISSELIPHLTGFLSDQARPENSLNAVNMLVQYAPENVAMLASLLPYSRPNELAALTDALVRMGDVGLDAVLHEWDREQANIDLGVDLTRAWGSPWWCVGDRKPLKTVPIAEPLSHSTQLLLHEYESVVAEHAVMAHKVPGSGLEALDRRLSDAAYRIASVSQYQIANDQYFAVLWVRDGATSRFVVDVTADELSSINKENRSAGFLPDAISAFRNRDHGSIQYACVWITVMGQNSKEFDADLYVDVHQDVHEQEGWGPMVQRGLELPRSNLCVRKDDGADYYTSVRWRNDRNSNFHDSWNENWDENGATHRHSRSLVGLQTRSSLQTEDSPIHGATAIWWTDIPIESHFSKYKARREHQRLARERIERGYYPVSIDVASIEKDPIPQFCSTWWRGSDEVAARTARSKRLTKLAVSLLRLGQDTQIRACLEGSHNAALRGATIAAFAENDLDPDWLMQNLVDGDASEILRRSCAMALGLFPDASLPNRIEENLAVTLRSLYSSEGDPGLRSAIESIAGRFNVPLQSSAIPIATGELQSVLGDRLVIIDPENPVWLGSPYGEPGRDAAKEPLVPVNLAAKYAIATREVTVSQFLHFRPNHSYAKEYAQTTDCPVINVSWFDAARYCRWLSEQEGIPESEMCYPRLDEFSSSMQADEGFHNRIGYRLPTEAEWEYACRGGVAATRWFGLDPVLLEDHAWTTDNSEYRLRPVGQLLPNDFGLFDMLGNAMEWCHAFESSYPTYIRAPIVDAGVSTLKIQNGTRMLTRGGANLYQPLDARSSQRNFHSAASSRVYITFRIARTIESEN